MTSTWNQKEDVLSSSDRVEALRFALLGPVRAWNGGLEVKLGSPQQRAVLLALLLGQGRPVLVHELVEAVWGGVPPLGAVSTVRTYASRLRRALEPDRPVTMPPRVVQSVAGGYAMRTSGRGALDLTEFEADVSEAALLRSRGEHAKAASLLARALDIWQGHPLAGIPGPLAEAERARLSERRLSVLETRMDLDIQLGRHDQVVGQLAALSDVNPLRERLHALLMLALYRCGRQAEALEVYRRTSRFLSRELGTAPGPELQKLHARMLASDPALAHPDLADATDARIDVTGILRTGPRAGESRRTVGGSSFGAAAAAEQLAAGAQGAGARPADKHAARRPGTSPEAPYVRPRQLPPDLPTYTGRSGELARAQALVPAPHEPSAVITIGGMAGVGKTALAVRLAHTVADQFPDGQLYINLRGFDPAGEMVDASAAIRAFLSALGVSPTQVPKDVDAQAALYRSVLANRRLMIVLDNVRDSNHVRTLLPGSPGCLVIVTSRDQLTGLAATHGSHPFTLDVLSEEEGAVFMAERISAERVASEPEVVRDIVAACGRLPLALAIVAARAAIRADFPLSTIASDLYEAKGSLDAFVGSDPITDARAAFSWSYQVLTSPAARLFRLLGLHPGPSLTSSAAASLAGLAPADTQLLLAELTRAHLLVEYAPKAYTLHDLLRDFATELTKESESVEERREAVRRLFDHYVHTAHSAALCLSPSLPRIPLPPPVAGSGPHAFRDRNQAQAWIDSARSTVFAVAKQSTTDEGFETHGWQLAWALVYYMQRQWGSEPSK
ncbi:BTAD domain-containing putative transcriptional regulator [Streptomyces sp. NPDC050625]|uniref:AfsR/SARP family transcriptional regulator n=1 Tax=Streptomyces sp. NPDC050625 TaxID=3154629 RepID=UPI0034170A76